MQAKKGPDEPGLNYHGEMSGAGWGAPISP